MLRRKISITIFVLGIICIGDLKAKSSAVTYDFSGGRFGDNLVSYCHAKWISYRYNIPLLYKPFNYSDQLWMHYLEIHYTPELEQQFSRVIVANKNTQIDPQSGDLYIIPFFPESIFNRNDTDFPYLFTVEWQLPAFKGILQQMISPLCDVKTPEIPRDCLSVAVHVRRGTGWDIPNYRITPEQLTASHPLRFAPDSFFIAQLKKIAALFGDSQIYVYLFTDHDNPLELLEKYKQAVRCDRMLFDCRTTLNNEFVNVLDDFFALLKFDCLIRADSNFSYIASKLGNYALAISPAHGLVIDGTTFIDEINFEMNHETCIVPEYQ